MTSLEDSAELWKAIQKLEKSTGNDLRSTMYELRTRVDSVEYRIRAVEDKFTARDVHPKYGSGLLNSMLNNDEDAQQRFDELARIMEAKLEPRREELWERLAVLVDERLEPQCDEMKHRLTVHITECLDLRFESLMGQLKDSQDLRFESLMAKLKDMPGARSTAGMALAAKPLDLASSARLPPLEEESCASVDNEHAHPPAAACVSFCTPSTLSTLGLDRGAISPTALRGDRLPLTSELNDALERNGRSSSSRLSPASSPGHGSVTRIGGSGNLSPGGRLLVPGSGASGCQSPRSSNSGSDGGLSLSLRSDLERRMDKLKADIGASMKDPRIGRGLADGIGRLEEQIASMRDY